MWVVGMWAGDRDSSGSAVVSVSRKRNMYKQEGTGYTMRASVLLGPFSLMEKLVEAHPKGLVGSGGMDVNSDLFISPSLPHERTLLKIHRCQLIHQPAKQKRIHLQLRGLTFYNLSIFIVYRRVHKVYISLADLWILHVYFLSLSLFLSFSFSFFFKLQMYLLAGKEEKFFSCLMMQNSAE